MNYKLYPSFVRKKISRLEPQLNNLLTKDEAGPERKENWHYRSVIGMLNFLINSTHPELAFAVHQCARFCENPKLSHERAVKKIV